MPSDRQLLALWRNLHHLNSGIRAALRSELDASGGCSLLEHDFMSWLQVDGPDSPRMQDLARLLDVTPGGVTRLVDRLVRRGLVERQQRPENRREVVARLTPAGKALLQGARTAYRRALRETLPGGLSTAELAELTRLTTQLVDDLGAAGSTDDHAESCTGTAGTDPPAPASRVSPDTGTTV